MSFVRTDNYYICPNCGKEIQGMITSTDPDYEQASCMDCFKGWKTAYLKKTKHKEKVKFD